MKIARLLAMGVAAMLWAGTAQAGLMQVTANGYIISSQDFTGRAFGAGAGFDTLVGRSIELRFVYDSNTAVQNLYDPSTRPHAALYAPRFSPSSLSSSWISAEAVIDGVALQQPGETPGPDNFANLDSIAIEDMSDPVAGREEKDFFGVYQGSVNVAQQVEGTLYTSFQVSLQIDTYQNFISGLSLDPRFSMNLDDDGYFFAAGSLNLGQVLATVEGLQYLHSGNLNYVARQVSVAPVPEPKSALMMLAGGLLLCGCLRPWRRHRGNGVSTG